MKLKNYRSGIIALVGLATINVANATDYSNMPTEQLLEMRSQARDMTTEDRDSYRNEMRIRSQSMTEDQKAELQQMRNQNRQGSGDGNGNQYRYDQSNSSGSYGSGYGSRQRGGGNYR